VNLIPGDQRSGASVGAGRSEGAAYAVLGVLAAIALMALLYGKANREVASDRSKAATLTAEAQQAQTVAGALAPYTAFVALREQRQQAVATLVDTRFDWAHAFHEFGRVLTKDVSLSSLDGTIAATARGTATAGAGAASSTTASGAAASPAAASPAATSGAPAAASVSSATPPGSVPTFSLGGCATSQTAVADLIQRLRLIDGVAGVTLQSSTRGSSSSSGAGAGGCSGTDPIFQITVAFKALPSAAASAAALTSKAKPVSDSTAGAPAISTSATSGGKTG
jgi:hypothetical protein